jgi:hypothetical protein
MVITLELSLYPNSDDYVDQVIAFCEALQNTPGLQVQVGVLSTLVTAEASVLWPALITISTQLWEKQQAVLHIKMARGPLLLENLPNQFK